MSKKDYLDNPLAGKDPVSQYILFKQNIKELKKNIDTIVNVAKPLISMGLTNGCEISKAISNKICFATSLINKQVETFDLNDNIMLKRLEKMQKKNITSKNQQGGGKINNYNVIVNPNTGKLVHIKSEMGIKILKKYIKNNF